jgi:hypothetical protein
MKTWMRSINKASVRLALGGSLFGLFGGIGGGCLSNAALTNYFTALGNGVIAAGAETVSTGDPVVDNIVIEPTTVLFSDLWTTWVDLWIPTDPVFENLLVQ